MAGSRRVALGVAVVSLVVALVLVVAGRPRGALVLVVEGAALLVVVAARQAAVPAAPPTAADVAWAASVLGQHGTDPRRQAVLGVKQLRDARPQLGLRQARDLVRALQQPPR
ncbi:hypothetical protein EV189_0482 [Motilibacter rhizosphaerae]|uniref:Uncharacterized protein n=1 Tax=Motilibacter rhizosphaerae TaxID=598652 RepID=A0A4Q7NVF9_9ACTN|nr:hypothetical protein [Motilibacter rhizosphaerae]RZS91246.1 hypothetical protein EV189_0482 [Motilibacter rhizosphaerae]